MVSSWREGFSTNQSLLYIDKSITRIFKYIRQWNINQHLGSSGCCESENRIVLKDLGLTSIGEHLRFPFSTTPCQYECAESCSMIL